MVTKRKEGMKSKLKITKAPHKASGFKPPKWWECQWRRVPCGKDSCQLCGRINKQRKQHILKGEDPDSVESMLSDVHDSFAETLVMLRKGAKKFGIDLENLEDGECEEPPDHKYNPICKRLMRFYKTVIKLGNQAQQGYQSWPKTEAGKDLLWYPSMILVKTNRQLDNRWEMGRGEEEAVIDMEYTGYVLRESILILKKALTKLISLRTHQMADFNFCFDELESLEKEIVKI